VPRSQVSAHPEVRAIFLNFKETWPYLNIVMDGRDIVTVVVPDAKIKFFLTA
jgi:cytidylate kinase